MERDIFESYETFPFPSRKIKEKFVWKYIDKKKLPVDVLLKFFHVKKFHCSKEKSISMIFLMLFRNENKNSYIIAVQDRDILFRKLVFRWGGGAYNK